jgi:ligand-binding sensor domain-containing protein
MIRPDHFKYILTITVLLSLGFSNVEPRWNRITSGIRENQVKRIISDSLEPEDLWVVTEKAVYESKESNGRRSFTELAGQVNAGINDIFRDEGTIYAATNDGLYSRGLGDYHFKRIFYASNEWQRQCLAVSVVDGKLFLGTRKGLFVKKRDDVSWQTLGGELSDAPISQIVAYGGAVYALNSQTIFKVDPVSNSYIKLFTLGLAKETEIEEVPEDGDTVPSVEAQMLDFKGADAQTFYLATQKGVYATHDSGQNWNILPNDGLPFAYLRRLLVIKVAGQDQLLAATAKGVYRYEQNRWQQLYQGLESNNIFDLAKDEQGNIYAATDRGVFTFQAVPSAFMPATSEQGRKMAFNDYTDIENYFRFEPTIREVQAMAIEYAEVHPDKIKKWRKQAQSKALAPSLSTGVNRSATELFHWDSGPNPDNLLKGKDYLDWDVGLSWNLSELIWNNDQTSIDSRSKLMVELREDVLDQVTRIYFERRRIQVDLLSSSGLDAAQKIEQQMRLAELTAIIDGFTGGKFSRAIESKSNEA